MESLKRAEALLQEAVYRSRARQAAGSGLMPGAANCGLGKEAAVDLDLSEEGLEHFRSLWPEDPPPEELGRIRAVMGDWVVRQDGLDRDRNHFLKAFRREHGFDRRQYGEGQLAAYEEGLARINASVDAERGEAARKLLGPTGRP